MITTEYVAVMSAYTRWQNLNLVTSADGLSDAARRSDRGAFFGSIFGTFNHLLWADKRWLHRFAGTPAPRRPFDESVEEVEDWHSFKQERRQLDDRIVAWCAALTASTPLDGQGAGDGGPAPLIESPVPLRIVHFFNHGTHHRGQIHAMLTAAGAAPDVTDLLWMPDTLP